MARVIEQMAGSPLFIGALRDVMESKLAISWSILQSHGGRLWAVGKDVPGAMFHFTVPKYREEEAHAPNTGT